MLAAASNPEAARYVRIDGAVNLAEVEVWAWVSGTLTNVALGKTVKSHNAYNAVALGKLVDGDAMNHATASTWVQIDLGQAYVIDKIVVVPRHDDVAQQSAASGIRISTAADDMGHYASATSLPANGNVVSKTVSGTPADSGAVLEWTRSFATDDATPTLSGTLAAALGTNEVLAAYDGSTRLGAATLNGTNWSFTPGTDLLAGTHTLRMQVEDATSGTANAGRANSATFTVNVGGAAPTLLPTIVGMTDAAGPQQGSVAAGGVTDDRWAVVSGWLNGTLATNQVLAIYEGATRLGTAAVSGSDWTFTPIAGFAFGSHSLTAVVENLATGAQGTASAARSFDVQAVMLAAVTDDAGLLQGNVLPMSFIDGTRVSNGTATTTDDTALVFSGTLGHALETGQKLYAYDGQVRLGEATITGTDWTFTPSAALSQGSHGLSFQVEATAAPGVAVVGTAASVTVQSADPAWSALSNGLMTLTGANQILDLTLAGGTGQPEQLRIDRLDLTGIGNNTVKLDATDALLAGADLYNNDNGWTGLVSGGRHQIRIDGDAGDVVNVTDASGWSAAGTVTVGDAVTGTTTYNLYNYGTTAQLLIDSDLTRQGAVL